MKKLLFVCTINRMRSRTAEDIFKEDERFQVKSAGIADTARVVLDRDLLEWADYIFVMEKRHRNFIRQKFPSVYDKKRIICLFIPDEYDYMDPLLISMLREKIDSFFGVY